MSAQHTPGPWSADRLQDRDTFNIFAKSFASAMCQVSVMENADRLVTGEEVEANARLIAAAPDLLEALRALHAACVKDGWPVYGAHPAAMNAALAAIAKATGQKGCA